MVRKKQLFFMYAFILSLANFTVTYSATSSLEDLQEQTSSAHLDTPVDTAAQDDLKNIIEQELKITHELDTILSDILIQCGNETIRTTNPDTHITSLTHVRTIVQQQIAPMQGKALLDNVTFSLPEVAQLTHFNALLMQAIEELIHSNFEKPIALLTTRGLPDHDSLDLDLLKEECANNAASFQDIEVIAKGAGLSWYNKLYRTIRPYTVAPAQRHAMALEVAAALTAMGIYLLHQYPHDMVQESWAQPVLAPVKNFVGDSAKTQFDFSDGLPRTSGLDPSTATKPFGQLVGWLNRLMSPNDPVGSKLFGYLGGACLAGYTYVRPKIAEKCTQLDNFLLGGVHRKQNTLSAYTPKIYLEDIVGMESEKEQAKLLIQSVLEPEKFARSGATPPSTMLFIGGSRAGKTYFAEAIGGEIAQRTGNEDLFLKVRPGHIADYGFEGLLFQAQRFNIRVLFIDEFHRYFKNGSNQDMLNGALTALNQNYDPKNPVIVICATNDPASLPHDLRNRFEVIVRFGKTSLNDRAIYLERELRKSGVKLEAYSFAHLVRETQNCSFEALQRLMKAAKRDALVDKQALAEKHIWQAFDREIRGIILNDTKYISPATQTVITANIAGETLIRILLEDILEEEVSAATTQPYNASIQEASLSEQWWTTVETAANDHKRYGKVFTHALFDVVEAVSLEQQRARCQTLIAGYMGEAIVQGACGYGYRPELYNKALKIALGIVNRGINLQEVAPEVRAQYERQALEYLKNIEVETAALIEEHQAEFYAIKLMLDQYKILYREDLLTLTTKEIALQIFDHYQKQMAAGPQEPLLGSSDALPEQPEGLDVVLPSAQ